MISYTKYLFVFVACLSLAVTGCGDTKKKEETKKDPHAGHDHGAHGPNGGHMLELTPGGMHAEWNHTEEGLITVWILDDTAKKEVAIEQEKVVFKVEIEGSDTTEYELEAVDAEEGKASKFEVTDENLLQGLETAGKGAKVTLMFSHDDKDYTGNVEHDEHHDHNH